MDNGAHSCPGRGSGLTAEIGGILRKQKPETRLIPSTKQVRIGASILLIFLIYPIRMIYFKIN